jgi:hypothetical protein
LTGYLPAIIIIALKELWLHFFQLPMTGICSKEGAKPDFIVTLPGTRHPDFEYQSSNHHSG